MNHVSLRLLSVLGFALPLLPAAHGLAQTVTVNLSSQKQYIRGFGGMAHADWIGDMTAAERTLAFGSADGQLGFSILRIPVTDGSPNSANVATAKAALAAGAIVFATPWNAKGTYTSSQFASYATHLNDFVSYMKNQGVNLYAISVQNEPDYGAQAGWGSWTAAACHDFIVNYGASITTKLMSCESFNYKKSYYDVVLNDPAAMANVALFGTHLYGTNVNDYAYPLFDTKSAGKERWMTEHYTDSNTDANSWPNALGVAEELHNSMVTGQFNAYVWWYIKRSYGFINNGAVTKRGWCIAHWSKFVRPGSYRVDATASPTSGVLVSAYKSDSDVVIVAVNKNSSAKSVQITVSGSSINSYDKYITSSSKSLASDGKVSATNGSISLSLDASSVVTLRGSDGTNSGGGTPSTGGSASTGGATSGGGGTAAITTTPATGGAVAAGGSSPTSSGTAATGGTRASGNTDTRATGGRQQTTSTVAPGSGGAATSTGGAVSTVAGTGGTGSISTFVTGGSDSTAPESTSDPHPTQPTGGATANWGDAGVNGTSATESGDSGCGCKLVRSSAGRAPTSALLVLLGLVGAAQRRERRKNRRGN